MRARLQVGEGDGFAYVYFLFLKIASPQNHRHLGRKSDMVEAHTPFVYARARTFGGYHQAKIFFFKALGDKLDEVVVLRAVDTYAPQFAYDPAVPRFGV